MTTTWKIQLIMGKNGPRACLANAITALRDAPEWQGLLWFDIFRQRTTLRGQPPWAKSLALDEEEAWTDHHDRLAAKWLQHTGISVSPDIAGQAAETVARENPFHPIIGYLVDLKWDRAPRLDTWAIKYLSAEDTSFVRTAAARFLIAAVARVLVPGCKADCALILEGPQGLLKSTALRTLFAPWFTDDVADLGSKDAAVQISGAWCVEMAELDSIRRGEVSKIKAFMSRQTDRFRPPYGRRVIEQPRQCVFAGTTNDAEYLRDETGGRRFWPIACVKIDIPGLAGARDQLWAEARARYDQSEPWWLDTKALNGSAEAEQNRRLVTDPWSEKLRSYVSDKRMVGVDELLSHIGIPIENRDQRHANRIASCLKAIGWASRPTRVTDKPHPVKRYYPPETT